MLYISGMNNIEYAMQVFSGTYQDDRGWQPLLIKGILVPSSTAAAPLDHPCHKKEPLHPCLPLPCWTPRVIRSFLGNPLHFPPIEKN